MSYAPDLSAPISSRCGLRRQNPQGRETRRSPRRAAHEVRAGDQSEDREGLGLTIPPSIPLRADEIIQ